MSRGQSARAPRLRSALGKARRDARSWERTARLLEKVALKAMTKEVHPHASPLANVCTTELHEQKKLDPAWWQSLPLVGYMSDLELRNCACGSTLAMVLP